MNLQVRWDPYRAKKAEQNDLNTIHDFHHLQEVVAEQNNDKTTYKQTIEFEQLQFC